MNATDTLSLQLPEPNQLAEFAPWDLDFRQMSRGSGRTNIRVRSGRSISALSLEIEARVHQTGGAPSGMLTLGVARPRTVRRWLGENVPENAFFLFGTGQEFEGITEAGFLGTTVSITQPYLDALGEDFGLDPAEHVLNRGVLDLTANPRAAKWFIEKTQRFLEHRSGTSTEETEDDIGLAVLLAASAARACSYATSTRLRDRVLARALGLIEASPDDPPSIRELCVQSGASWPTLRRAFLERFEVGPKTYLTQLRLSRVRTDLIAAAPGTKVSDVANRWGFWHMGKFAGDYHKLFNRLPSDDLSLRW